MPWQVIGRKSIDFPVIYIKRILTTAIIAKPINHQMG